MFKTEETKAFGSIRKVKHYGACGVILGMAALAMAFSSGSVSADELSANQNVPKTVQEAPKEEVPKQDETAKKNTTVDVVVDHSTVDKAVSEAKKAGLEVKQDSPVDVGVAQGQEELVKKQVSVEKDYANQANTVSTEIAGYKKDVADNESEKKRVQDENEKIRQNHEKAKKDLKEKNDQIDKRNDDAQKKYDQEYGKYLEKDKEFKQAKADLEKLGLAGSATGVKMYGEYNEAGRGSMN
ncbi:putative cross-wall-targeting lipoprotein signal, partial [Streptococcus oralis SK304]